MRLTLHLVCPTGIPEEPEKYHLSSREVVN